MSNMFNKPLVYADAIPGGYQQYLQDYIKPLPHQRRRLSQMLEEHLATQPDYSEFIADMNGIQIIFKNREEQLVLRDWLSKFS